MKWKIFFLLLTGVLLTGCGVGDSDTKNSNGLNGVEGTIGIEESLDGAEFQATTPDKEEMDGESEQESYILTFEATTVNGETVTDDCFGQSKLTMLNVWATYCNPCLSEMPDLGQIAAFYDKAEFQMLGIISDVTEDAEDVVIEEARGLIEQTQADYPHLLLSQSLYMNLVGAVDAVPTTFFVNQQGEVLGYVVGAGSKEDWEEIINELLAKIP